MVLMTIVLIWILANNCQPLCPPLSPNRIPRNAYTSVQCRLRFATPGILCRIQCNRGHHIVGSRFRRCLYSGVWWGRARCIKNTQAKKICQQMRFLDNGLAYNYCNDKFVVGCLVVFKCDDDFELEGEKKVQCLDTGKWSAKKPECKAKPMTTKCPELSPPQNGYWISNQNGRQCNGSPGQICRLFCIRGPVVGQTFVYCDPESFKWSKPIPKCIQ